jgi:hypothetical protein
MDELLDMIATDQSPAEVSDQIKNILFNKASEKVDSLKPGIAASLFKDQSEEEQEVEEEE